MTTRRVTHSVLPFELVFAEREHLAHSRLTCRPAWYGKDDDARRGDANGRRGREGTPPSSLFICASTNLRLPPAPLLTPQPLTLFNIPGESLNFAQRPENTEKCVDFICESSRRVSRLLKRLTRSLTAQDASMSAVPGWQACRSQLRQAQSDWRLANSKWTTREESG